MLRKRYAVLFISLALILAFTGCDADMIAQTGSFMASVGTNVVNPNGYENAVEDTIDAIASYINSGDSADLNAISALINQYSTSDSSKAELRSGLSVASRKKHADIIGNYTSKADTLVSTIESRTTQEFADFINDFWNEMKASVDEELNKNASSDYDASYTEVVVNGFVCLMLDKVTGLIDSGLPSTLNETLDVLNPVLAGLKAVDNLTDLGIFALITDLVNTIDLS